MHACQTDLLNEGTTQAVYLLMTYHIGAQIPPMDAIFNKEKDSKREKTEQ